MRRLKYTSILLSSLLAFQAWGAETDKTAATKSSALDLNQFNVNSLYTYSNFNYNSSTPSSYNRYHGHSNMLTVGTDFQVNQFFTLGLFVYSVSTDLNSYLLLPNSIPNNTSQQINNDSAFVHLLKQVSGDFYVDIAGGYGKNKSRYFSLVNPKSSDRFTGNATGYSDDWFGLASLVYNYTFSQVLVRSNVTFLYNQISQDSFLFEYTNMPPQFVPKLINQSSLLMENLELALNNQEFIQPFINGGLIQVLQYSNSRPIFTGTIVGALPNFNLNQDGYNLGIGVSLTRGRYTVRLEEKYFQRGDVYHNNVSLLTLRVNVD